ncbi:hypothetical protein Patl1_18401 [Pistacia atlantica]|uniref:Uncharacterized protein n=1 Tax=Pistacia atlantica TaxID=434234 RepID=A0ACC1C1E0_9ROSI|nr:hypothetical protein Patl1_18401 [Pistacia atlantica]
MLVQEETRLKNQGTHSIHLESNQKARKKHGKGKQGPSKVNGPSSQIHKKEHKKDNCHFCGKPSHFQKDCLKRKAWFEKKGSPYDPNNKSK